MATDYRTKIAGDYAGIFKIPMILNEGAPTVVSRAYGATGMYQKMLTWADELKPGDIVALANDADCTFAATGGQVVVERPVNGEAFVIGKILEEPASDGAFPAASADANDLSERLAGKYYRTALVEPWGGITKIVKAIVLADGSNAVTPGATDKLKVNITASIAQNRLCLVVAANGGSGLIALHAVPAGTSGDQYDCLVGITGPLTSVTGA